MITSTQHAFFLPPVKGARPDLDPLLVPDDSAHMMVNFVRHAGQIKVREGLELFQTINQGGQERIASVFRLYNEDIGPYLLLVSDTAIYRYDENTQTFVSLMPPGMTLSGNDSRKVHARLFFKTTGSHAIIVNGVDTPKVLEPNAATVRNLVGNPPAAEAIATAANRVLLSEGSIIYVSAFNDCDAGYQTEQIVNLADTPGRILAMLERGNLTTIIFKQDAIYEAVASGGAEPFHFGLRLGNIVGPASGTSIVPLPDGNYLYLGADAALYLYDGVNVQPAPNSQAANVFLRNSANRAKMFRAFAYWDHNYSGAVFFVPSYINDACSAAVLVTYPDFTVYPLLYDQPITAAASVLFPSSPTWEDFDIPWGPNVPWETISGDMIRTILTSNDSNVYIASGTMDVSSPIVSWIETKGLSIPENAKFVTIHGAECFAAGGPATLTLELLTTDYGELETLYDYGPEALGDGDRIAVGFRASCRSAVLRIKFVSEGPVFFRGAALAVSVRGQR